MSGNTLVRHLSLVPQSLGSEEQNVIITIEGNVISIKHFNGQCCTLAKWFIIETIGM